MCRIFKTIYACGHRDVINAPCEWRDEGIINILGYRVPCEKSIHNRTDLSRACMGCSPSPARQDLVEIDSHNPGHRVESYISYDQKRVMATIVRNEAHLRRRANTSQLAPVPVIFSNFPTSSEIQHQCHVNIEFLARRLKRRQFQRHLEGRGEYQDFLDASQAHLDAKNSLRNSLFSHESPPELHSISASRQKFDVRTNRVPTSDSSTQTDNTETAIAHLEQSISNLPPESDSSSRTITIFLPQMGSDTVFTTLPESDDQMTIYRQSYARGLDESSTEASLNLGESSTQQTRQRSQDILIDIYSNDEERDFMISREAHIQRSPRFLQIETESAQEGESERNEQFNEYSDFGFGFGEENDERGTSTQDFPPEKFELDSPEGIERLVDIRQYLGMRADTKPIDIWNFANRNEDLLASIAGNVLPIRPQGVGKARRNGFERDAGIRLISDYADKKWELGKGFVETWNSLNWSTEALVSPEFDNQHPGTTEKNVETSDSNFNELDPILNDERTMRNDTDLNTTSSEGSKDQGEDLLPEDKENKRFPLLGRRATASYDLSYSGRLMIPSHQARNASRLRVSWTYADEEKVATSLNLPEEQYSDFYLQTSSTSLQGETVSPLSSPGASPISQDLLGPLTPSSLISASILYDDAIPSLALDGSAPDVQTEERPSWSSSQEEPQSQDVSDEDDPDYPSSSSAFIPASVFSRTESPIPYPASSPRGQELLSYLRQFLAMPPSATPQDISSYIDRNPGLMDAIRDRRVPAGESPWEETLRKSQESEPSIDHEVPRNLLNASTDHARRDMQAKTARALQMLDWEEIDAEPVLFTPATAPWEAGWVVSDCGRDDSGDDDDDEEEECDSWVRSTVFPNPGDLEELSRMGLTRYQVERPSPLRTTLTRRDVDVNAGEPVQTGAAMGSDISPDEQ